MTDGEVSPNLEAVTRLLIRGPNGVEQPVDCVVDTGFTDYMTLSPETVTSLGLPFRETMRYTLADGTIVPLDVHRGEVFWNDAWQGVLVTSTEGGALAGMALLHGSSVLINVRAGG